MPKRVLMLNYEFPPLGGGQATANAELLRAWEGEDIIIDCVAGSAGDYEERACAKNIHIYLLDIGKQWRNLHAQSFSDLIRSGIRTYRFAKMLIAKHRYDSIVCWSYPPIILWWLLGRKYAIPYVCLLRGASVPGYAKKWQLLDRVIFRWFAPFLWRRSSAVIANSSALRDLAYRSYQGAITVIPNGIDTDRFSPRQIPIPLETVRFLFVGRLSERKGVDILIEAFSRIQQKNWTCTLVGDGEKRKQLEAQTQSHGLEERIIFAGGRPRERMPETYRDAHVFVFPSRNEGMSNAALEALASGLPVIHTPVGGAEELIDEGKTGTIIAVNDVTALAEAVRYFLEHPEKIAPMSLHARQKALEFRWKSIARTFQQYF